MGKQHKMRVRWTAETRMDLPEIDNPDFQETFNKYIIEEIIKDFGSLENFYDYCNQPKIMSVKTGVITG